MAHSKQMEKDVIELTNALGVSGHEENVTKIVKAKLSKIPGLKYEKDNLGSLAAIKKGKGGAKAPTISIVAHMDEVGFMLTNITSTGFLKFEPLGG